MWRFIVYSQQLSKAAMVRRWSAYIRTDPASLGAGSQAPRFNATVVAWPLSCCGIATPVSFAMHLFNPLGVRSYRESRAVL